MYVYAIEQTHIELAKAELDSYGKCEFHGTNAISQEKLSCETSAFTKWRARVVWHGSKEGIKSAITVLPWRDLIKKSFSCTPPHGIKTAITPGSLGKLIQENSGRRVKLEQPDVQISTILIDETAYIAIIEWKNEEDFAARKNHLLPASHPTALHPKIARAMVNIARNEEILDPFCGSGGILIEALLAGKKAHGIELDPKQATRARTNIESMKFEANVIVGDSLEVRWPQGTIVTDMPLGRNTKISTNKIAEEFLEKAYNEKRRVVMGCAQNEKIPKNWKIEMDCTIRFHKSLSKRIISLTPSILPE
jgi:tRNA (guanine10-N2)-dimethyltransferase